MISAADALRQPGAQLTADEMKAADALEAAIDAHILAKMKFAGCDNFATPEQNTNVIAAVNQRFRRRGAWLTSWNPIERIEAGKRLMTSWRLDLKPTDAAYAEAEAHGKN